MPPPVYSTQFIDDTILGGHSDTYVVPTGFRAVVRDVSGVFSTTGTFTASVATDVDGDTFQFQGYVPNTGGPFHWEGHAVANDGQGITFTVNGTGAATVVVSGYLLSAP